MGLTHEVAAFIAGQRYERFSKQEVKAAKELIFDCLGAMIGGATEKASQIAIKSVRAWDDGGQCGVFGGSFKTSPINAALINATAAHAQELESIGLYTGSNPMTVIPAALAVAEAFKLPGRAVIEGTILGLEVQTKLGIGGAGSFDKGFSSIPIYGGFGAAAAVAKMLGFGMDEIQHAIGIAVAQASGQQRQQGTMTHLLEAGLACRNGVTAALLARDGMTSDPNLIEGDWGFYELFCSAGRGYNIESVLRGLGNPYCITQVYVKKYGCCFWNHRALDAAVRLVQQHRMTFEQIESVSVEIPVWIAKQLRFPDPRNGEEAKFSLRHALGAIVRQDGNVPLPLLDPFTDVGAVDPRYCEARQKVNVIERKDWSAGRAAPWSTPVTIALKDGSRHTDTVGAEHIKGGPWNPLTEEELVRRYTAVVTHFLSEEQIRRSVALAFDLEHLDDVSELTTLATFGKA